MPTFEASPAVGRWQDFGGSWHDTGAYDEGADATGYDDAAAAAVDVANDARGIRLSPRIYSRNLDLSFGSPAVALDIPQGAILKPPSGKTYTIDGPVRVGGYQWIDTSLGGSVRFGRAVNVIDPRWFGAKANDGTNDDYAAVTAAVAAATASGATGRKVIDFGAGAYGVSNIIAIQNATGITLRINGTVRKTLGTSAACVFRVLNCSDVTIEGSGTIDGGYTGVSTGSNPTIEIGVAGTASMLNSNIRVRGLSIKNGNHACITCWGETNTGNAGNQDVFLTDLKLERAGAGIFIYKGCSGLFISNVVAKNCGANGLVLDTRAQTDTNTTTSYPISQVSIRNLRIIDTVADAGFEPRGITIKGAVSDVDINGLFIKTVTANHGVARNTYGVLIAQSYGPGTAAVATATLTGTSVSSFTVSAGGSGYTTPPKVFIQSASGSGARATAVLTGDVVTSITVDAGGEGYTEAPFVQLISGETGENIRIVNATIENVQDLFGTTGWPMYVQSGWRDVVIKAVRMKNCKRGINIDAADVVHIEDIIGRDLPLQASTFPIQIAGTSATAPATNIAIYNADIDRGSGLSSATHAISTNFVDGIRLRDNRQRGFDTGLYSVNTTNTKRMSGAIGSATVDPANLADGGGVTLGVSCPGAELGDFAECAFSNSVAGMSLTAYVSAVNIVSCRFQNESGGALDLASGTLRVRTTKP